MRPDAPDGVGGPARGPQHMEREGQLVGERHLDDALGGWPTGRQQRDGVDLGQLGGDGAPDARLDGLDGGSRGRETADQQIRVGRAGLAAWLALDWRAGLATGETVLVLGAGGVVGQVAVQAARLLGASRVIAAARSEDGLRRAREELGADATATIADDPDALAERLTELAGAGFDVMIDTLWGAPAAVAVAALAAGGRLVQIGNAAGAIARLPALAGLGRPTAILGHVNFMAPQPVKADAYRRLRRHAAAGELTVPTERVGLDAIGHAWHRQQQSPRCKLVIVPR